MHRHLYHTALCLCIAGSAGLLYLQNDKTPTQASSMVTDTNLQIATLENASVTRHDTPQFAESTGALPAQKRSEPSALPARSLQDIPAPEIALNADGSLKVDFTTRLFFEHYLSAIGEDTLEEISVRVRHALKKQLQGQSLEEALALYENYIAYRIELTHAIESYLPPSQQRFDLEKIRNLRQLANELATNYFDADSYHALYGAENDYYDYIIAHTELQSNTQYTHAEKQLLIDQLKAQTSEDIVSQLASEDPVEQYQSLRKEWANAGYESTQIQEALSATLDQETLTRIRHLEAARSSWQKRVSNYRVELANLGDYSNNTGQVDALRNTFFSETEQQRIAALDRLHGLVP